jgi:hypothetical protein
MPSKPGPLRPHEERLTYARREPPERPPGEPKPGDSFLIVTEGEVTERMYFESVRKTLKVNPVTVRVVHPPCTDAEGLVRAAVGERDAVPARHGRSECGSTEVARYDQVWVIFDTDVAARQGQLGPALDLARKEHIHIGLSTPSVEVWLLLHFRDRPGQFLDSTEVEHALGKAWGQHYDKREETFPKLWQALKPNIPAAVSRAFQVREYHRKAATPPPPNPSTDLDLLVRALDASVQPPRRILRWA